MWSCPCSSDKPSEKGVLSGPLGGLVKNVIKKIGKGRFTEEEIASVWAHAAGRKAAGHTRPISFRKSVLLVNVDSSSWLYELTTRKKEILKKLARHELAGKKMEPARAKARGAKGGTLKFSL